MSDTHTPQKYLRTIRSYVQRAGRITPGQSLALSNLWQLYGLEMSDGLLDVQATFKRQAPLTLEIGFGMGHSLLQMAIQNPNQDFIGIEVHRPGVGAILAKIQEYSLTNLRIYRADALEVLAKCIPEASLTAVLLFFPDPWPKKKHHKRRIVQNQFIDLVWKKLTHHGYIHMATDVADYAQHMLALFNAHSGFIPSKTIDRPATKFEKRGEKLGHSIFDMVFSKLT